MVMQYQSTSLLLFIITQDLFQALIYLLMEYLKLLMEYLICFSILGRTHHFLYFTGFTGFSGPKKYPHCPSVEVLLTMKRTNTLSALILCRTLT